MSTISLGYTIFYVDDVGATVAFFERAFGLERRFVTPENDYGELVTGATTLAFVSIELAQANLAAAGGFVLPDTSKPSAASITLVTPDIEAAVDVAIAAGAASYVDPIAKPWGQTVAYLLGPSNVLIEIATPIASK
ncbi:MAG: catechol 2,3-dioxygenase-like lactoylglutathione lyase family enzyme [Ilumatobacter sp.]|jgi:lactoylglutathione lyase